MIRSFKGKKVAEIAAGRSPKGFPPDLVRAARQKLFYLDSAGALNDLLAPPGNRLKAF